VNVIITGANRGLGLEFARQVLARGDVAHAGVRDPAHADALAGLPGRLTIAACDVTDDASVRAFAAAARRPVDVLINNAGIRIRPDGLDDLAAMADTYATNAIGALRVTAAVLPAMGRGAKIVNLSSGLASIADNTSGGVYGYRMAKAALNMATRSLAADLAERGILALALSPGWVPTDMGGADAPTPIADSVAGMLRVIDGLTDADSGAFLDFLGARLPW
jgi:NAD(P)-dependent dehydrogenase (short-subunit alcohol dehydrogenase family)